MSLDPTAAAFEAFLATPAGAAAVQADVAAPAAPAAPPAAPIADATVVAPAPAPAAAPAAAPVIDYTQLAQALAAHGAVPGVSAPAPVPAEKAPVASNQFTKGQMVEHSWDDPYDGPSSRAGIVLETLPDQGSGAQSVVAWFDSVSGPIGDQFLTAV